MGFWASVYPFDTVKTMMQTDDLKAPKYRGMLDACSKVSVPAHTAVFEAFIQGLIKRCLTGSLC